MIKSIQPAQTCEGWRTMGDDGTEVRWRAEDLRRWHRNDNRRLYKLAVEESERCQEYERAQAAVPVRDEVREIIERSGHEFAKQIERSFHRARIFYEIIGDAVVQECGTPLRDAEHALVKRVLYLQLDESLGVWEREAIAETKSKLEKSL